MSTLIGKGFVSKSDVEYELAEVAGKRCRRTPLEADGSRDIMNFEVLHVMQRNEQLAVLLRADRREIHVGGILYGDDSASWRISGVGTQTPEAHEAQKLSIYARSVTGSRAPKVGEILSAIPPSP